MAASMTRRRRSDCFGVSEFSSGARPFPVALRAAARFVATRPVVPAMAQP
jgi:hypothetical protein